MDEPYTVLSIELRGPLRWVFDNGVTSPAPPGLFNYNVYYRNYDRRSRIVVIAKDELEAFMLGQKRLVKTKKHYDKYGKKKEQTS